jgi:uncharacterized protein with GYD domain
MARYVILVKWTPQGIKTARDTIQRVADARVAFEKAGAKIRDFVWTLGSYDAVISVDAPNDETIAALGLQVGMLGNATTTTLRAFDESEMTQILKKV